MANDFQRDLAQFLLDALRKHDAETGEHIDPNSKLEIIDDSFETAAIVTPGGFKFRCRDTFSQVEVDFRCYVNGHGDTWLASAGNRVGHIYRLSPIPVEKVG
jgi:hypothetical protein